jgi:uncharacterized protein (DUF433 family)
VHRQAAEPTAQSMLGDIDSFQDKSVNLLMDFSKFIEIVPDKRFGKPCIRGTRISVYDVLNWLASGMTKKDIIGDYPELSEEQINACLSFAADREHRLRVA